MADNKITIDGTEYVVNLNPGEQITPELLADKLGIYLDDGSFGEADEEREVKIDFKRK